MLFVVKYRERAITMHWFSLFRGSNKQGPATYAMLLVVKYRERAITMHWFSLFRGSNKQ